MRVLHWLRRRIDRAIGPPPLPPIDRLVPLIAGVLRESSPLEKQRFYAWAEGHAHEDGNTLELAEQVFTALRRQLERFRGTLDGLRVLELGPGHTLVPGLLLYVHGVRSYVGADMFPIASTESGLYRRLRQHLAKGAVVVPVEGLAARRAAALRRFDEAVDLSGELARFDPDKVVCRSPVDAAKLPFPDGSFDVVVSNASFEHFKDPGGAVKECTRVLAPSGLGLHQIDLRDHRDFAKPLAFLDYSDEEWLALNARDPFCYTNRWRKQEFTAAFSEGAAIENLEVSLRAEVTPELRSRMHPRFRERPQEDLEALSTFFVVRKA